MKKIYRKKYKMVNIIALMIIPIMFLHTNLAEATVIKFDNPKNNSSKNMYINARNAIAIDMNTKRVLFEKNAYDQTAIASTTKIMTTLVALNYGDLQKKIEISPKSANIHGSTVGYRKGEKVTMEELLYGLMLRSGNDAAIAIAEGMAGSVENFCKLMNEYAYSIGSTNSHFESPHGLDSTNHYSTAYDLALITCKAKEFEEFNNIVSCKQIDAAEKGFTRSYNNINKILWQIPEANGVKTGYTGNAGKCLVTSVKMPDSEIVIVVINSPTRWQETKKIYDYVKENYNFEKIAAQKQVLGTKDMENGKKLNLVNEKDIIFPVKKGCNYKKEVVFNKDLNNIYINRGDKIGKLILKDDDGNIIYESSLISDKSFNKPNKKLRFKFFRNILK